MDFSAKNPDVSPAGNVHISAGAAESINEYLNLPIGLLASRLRKQHHHLIKGQVDMIRSSLNELRMLYSEKFPELDEIAGLFRCITDTLTTCVDIEESELFPLISDLPITNFSQPDGFQFLGREPESIIEDINPGYQFGIDCFKTIRVLSNGYTVPVDGSALFQQCYQLLEAFEQEFMLLIYIETQIVFPKTMALHSLLN